MMKNLVQLLGIVCCVVLAVVPAAAQSGAPARPVTVALVDSLPDGDLAVVHRFAEPNRRPTILVSRSGASPGTLAAAINMYVWSVRQFGRVPESQMAIRVDAEQDLDRVSEKTRRQALVYFRNLERARHRSVGEFGLLQAMTVRVNNAGG